MAEYKPYLDRLFENAEQLMWELSKDNGYFTNYEFLRRAAQRQQGAYVGLLNEVLEHRGEDYLFNIAHENIGNRLSRTAKTAGYDQDKNAGISEKNIWGDDTPAIAYRRTERVGKMD